MANHVSRRRKKKMLPGYALVFIDVCLIGVSLVVFSLFHHVIPRQGSEDLSKLPGGYRTPPVIATTTPPAATEGPTDNLDPSIDTSGWGYKFYDKFTTGEVEKTDTSYRSKDVSVTMTKVQENGVTYYIQDIYIRSIDNIRTAFAQDKYGRGITENTLEMAVRNNAICAINGDYYGAGGSGDCVVIRNGYLYKSSPDGDVLVLYYDGTMKTYSKDEFDGDTAMANNAYQAWCFGPALLKDGKAMTDFDSDVKRANPRSAIGYYEPGHYCFLTVDGRQPGYSDGMTLAQMSELFESLGCVEAYNLDGGQTAMMTFGDSVANQPYNGGRSCSDIIYICEWEGV